MQAVLVNGRVLTEAGVVDGKAVLVENGVIAGVIDAGAAPASCRP
jgi:N-acetylglucosamine-6-phosphate deacetylase